VQIATGTNALIGVYAGTGATASAFYFNAAASTTPGIDIQVGSTIYSGTTASGCSSFVAGICVASGSAVGTVYSIATSGPISGGTITTSGTISCSTCLTTAGGQTISGSETFSGPNNLFQVNQQSLFGRIVNIEPSYQDEVALDVYGYTGGSADLLDVYNQPSGTKEFYVTRNNAVVNTGYGLIVQDQSVPSSQFAASICDSCNFSSAKVVIGSGATASGVNMYAVKSGNPYLIMTVGTTNYNGVTGTGVCTHFVGGICVSF
jgi:hypothetical protein